MKLAIVTCSHLPKGVNEDKPLFDALKQQNIELQIHPWDAAVDWSLYDACLIRSTWDYHQRIDEFTAWLNATSEDTQIINKAEVLLWNLNKKYLIELADFGITVAPTTWLKNDHALNLQKLINQQSATTYFLKPVIGADSSDTLRFNNNPIGIEQAQAHLDKLLPQQEMMLQPYMHTVETFGETSAIYFSGNFSHAVRKIPKSDDYRVQDTFGATDIPYKLDPVEMSLSKACLQFLTDKFGELCYARFDFLHDEAGTVYLNEAELIEPSLFFYHDQAAVKKFTHAIQKKLSHQLQMKTEANVKKM